MPVIRLDNSTMRTIGAELKGSADEQYLKDQGRTIDFGVLVLQAKDFQDWPQAEAAIPETPAIAKAVEASKDADAKATEAAAAVDAAVAEEKAKLAKAAEPVVVPVVEPVAEPAVEPGVEAKAKPWSWDDAKEDDKPKPASYKRASRGREDQDA